METEVPSLHFLHGAWATSFYEYEFFSDGRLLNYSYTDEDSESTDWLLENQIPLSPRFKIESLKWSKEGNKLFIYRASNKIELQYDRKNNCFFMSETPLRPTDRLMFFEKLREYCKPSILKETLDHPPFHLLHATIPGGFMEYEFRPDGKLLEYDYTKTISEIKEGISYKEFQSRFEVYSLRWIKNGRSLIIQRGPQKKNVLVIENSDNILLDGVKWDKIEHLDFFNKLGAYCEKSL